MILKSRKFNRELIQHQIHDKTHHNEESRKHKIVSLMITINSLTFHRYAAKIEKCQLMLFLSKWQAAYHLI
jgi:hypothetical protein